MHNDRDLIEGPIARRWLLCGERPCRAIERYPHLWMMPSPSQKEWTVARGLFEASWYSSREWREMFSGTMLVQRAPRPTDRQVDELEVHAAGRKRLSLVWQVVPNLRGIIFVGLRTAQSMAWPGEWERLSGLEFQELSVPATWLPLPLRSRHPEHLANTLFHEFFQRLREASVPGAPPPWSHAAMASRW